MSTTIQNAQIIRTSARALADARRIEGKVMEIGNLVFGHSRGNFPIERSQGWETELTRLFESYTTKGETTYGSEFFNNVFRVTPYWWGDCECGFDKRFDQAYAVWRKRIRHAEETNIMPRGLRRRANTIPCAALFVPTSTISQLIFRSVGTSIHCGTPTKVTTSR